MERAKGAADEEEAKRFEEVFKKLDDNFVEKESPKILHLCEEIDLFGREISGVLSTHASDGFFERMHGYINKLIEEKGLDAREFEDFIAELKEAEKSADEDAKVARATSIEVTNEVAEFAREVAEWTSRSRK